MGEAKSEGHGRRAYPPLHAMRKASLTRYLISLAAHKICAPPLHNVAFGRPFFKGAAFFASVY